MNQFTISKLQANNFRNLSSEIFEFSPGINCIIGNNGNGKTNLIEAVHFIIHKKSFRKNTSFPQLLSVDCGKPEILLSALFENKIESQTISAKLGSESSIWSVNGKIEKKSPKEISAIFVNPFDSFQFHTTPQFRRHWIDQHASYLDAEYKKLFNKYSLIMKMRNTLLAKKPHEYEKQIYSLDINLSETSELITKKRIEFVTELKFYIENTFKEIFEETHNLEIQLESKFKDKSKEEIFNYYRSSFPKDCDAKQTTYGIHRDDYVFHFDGLNSYEFCSLGQQKMSFLSLIFAYIELFRYKFVFYPIVLIDDVSGELDGHRWLNLINFLKKKEFQVLITTANEAFKVELEKKINIKNIKLENGKSRPS